MKNKTTSKKPKAKPKRPIQAAAEDFSPICMQGQLEISAAAGEDKKAPTFRMVAYTGGLLTNMAGWDYPAVVELAGMEIPSQHLPVRLQHDPRQGVGHTTSVSKSDGKLTAEGIISRDTIWARDVINSSRNGFPWQVSIGAEPKEVQFFAEGQKVKANGQRFEGPLYLVARSRLGELSFVDLGADTHTSAAIAAEKKSKILEKEQTMKRLKELRLLAQAFDGRLTREQIDRAILAAAETQEDDAAFTARLEAAAVKTQKDDPPGEPAEKKTPTEPAGETISAARARQIAEAAVAAEQNRQQTIRAEAGGLGISEELLSQCLADPKITLEAARQKMLEEIRARHVNPVNGAPNAIVSNSSLNSAQVIEAAGVLSCGRISESRAVELYGAQVVEAASRYRRLGVQDLFRLAAQAEGRTLPMLSMGENDFIRAAFSITSLPGILSNLANKALLEGFRYGEEEWRNICRIGRVSNFKSHTRYRLGSDFQYQKVGAGGELKHGTLSEQKYSIKADTFGIMIALTRQMIIDDDLGAFAQLPYELGQGANEAINAAVWPLLEDNGDSFFSSDNKNRPTAGAGNALCFESLGIAERAFLDQKKPNGKPLGILPAVLLVPTALKSLALHLMQSPIVSSTPGGLTETSKYKPTTNIYAGRFKMSCSAYLTSQTTWRLFADPAVLAAMEVAFLNGVDRPTIESGQPNFDTVGIQMRAYMDFGVAKQEHRAAVEMAIA